MKTRLAMTAILMLLLAACGSTDTPTETSVGDTPSESADQPTGDDGSADDSEEPVAEDDSDGEDDVSESDSDDDEEPALAVSSPIGEYLGGDFQSALVQYQIDVEATIVLCMAQQGFEFMRTAPEVSKLDQAAAELTQAEWTDLYGYGISTDFDSLLTGQMTDPNAELFFEMSPSERELWLETLTGSSTLGGNNVTGDEAPPLEEQGCVGQGIIETGGGDVIDGLEEFGSSYEEGLEGVNDTAAMIDATDAWARCMSEAGWPGYDSLDSPQDETAETFEALVAPLSAAMDTIDPEDARALIEDGAVEIEDLPGFDVDGLRELQDREIKLANIDLDCYELHVKEIYEPLRDAFERGIIVDYQSELDGLKSLGS